MGNDFCNSARRSSPSLLLVKPCLINLWGKDRKYEEAPTRLQASLSHFALTVHTMQSDSILGEFLIFIKANNLFQIKIYVGLFHHYEKAFMENEKE